MALRRAIISGLVQEEGNVSNIVAYVVVKVRLKKGIGPGEWHVSQEQFCSIEASLPCLEQYPSRLYIRKAEKHMDDGSVAVIGLD